MSQLRILSLGAGVQSTALALMAARGELAMPDAAVFADTGWEPRAVYEHLGWLEKQLPFPVRRVRRPQGDGIREDTLRSTDGGRFAGPPLYTISEGREGPLRRNCTKEYKLEPLQREVGRICVERGVAKKPGAVEQWIGISLDEAVRMKPSRVKYIRNVWPLIDRGMTRHDCLKWMERHGYPRPPKSSCIGCPYHSNAMWRAMKDHAPEEWADAVDFDRRIRQGKIKGVVGEAYLHRTLVPLDEVDLSTPEDHGQLALDGFGNECEGMCGV